MHNPCPPSPRPQRVSFWSSLSLPSDSHACTHTHTHACTHARSHTHACTHARSHTHTHTHTHYHCTACFLPLSLPTPLGTPLSLPLPQPCVAVSPIIVLLVSNHCHWHAEIQPLQSIPPPPPPPTSSLSSPHCPKARSVLNWPGAIALYNWFWCLVSFDVFMGLLLGHSAWLAPVTAHPLCNVGMGCTQPSLKLATLGAVVGNKHSLPWGWGEQNVRVVHALFLNGFLLCMMIM